MFDFIFFSSSFFFFKNSPRTTSGSVIPEENADDFWSAADQPNGSLSLPINNMGGSVASIDSARQNPCRNESPQSTYSPYGNSPGNDQRNSGYMLMSPGGDYNKT